MNLIWSKYENPVYVKEDQSMIDCILTTTSMGVIPFTASKNDIMDYGRELYAEIIANSDTIPINPYVPKAVTPSTTTVTAPSSGNNSGPTVI
jgi:hypothetical protein